MSKFRMQWLGLVLLAAGMLLAVQSWAQQTDSQAVTDDSSVEPVVSFKCSKALNNPEVPVCASGYCCENVLNGGFFCTGHPNDICCSFPDENTFSCSRNEECSSTGCVTK